MNARAWEFVRAIRGPVLLITFGALTSLNHTNKLDFERSWPVLIIVYGIFKLVERLIGRPMLPNVPPSWQQQHPGSPAPQYTPAQYPPPEYPPVYPPPPTPQGGAQ